MLTVVQNGTPSASKIDRELITDYILWLKEQTYAAATVARSESAPADRVVERLQ